MPPAAGASSTQPQPLPPPLHAAGAGAGAASPSPSPSKPTRKPLAASRPQHGIMAAMDAMASGTNATDGNGAAVATTARPAATVAVANGAASATPTATAAALPAAVTAVATADAPAVSKAAAKRAKKAAAAAKATTAAVAHAAAVTATPTSTPTPAAAAATAAAPVVTLTLAQQQQHAQRASNVPPPAATAAPAPKAAAAAVRLSSSSLPLCLPSDPSRPQSSSSVAAAAAFADLFVSFVRDAATAAEAAGSGSLRRCYVLEVGSAANAGKNAYQFLISLAQRVRELPFAAAARSHSTAGASSLASLSALSSCFTYVLSDPSQSALDNLRAHPQLQPLFDTGVLDLALLDPARPQPVARPPMPGAKGAKAAAEPAIELYLQNSSQLLCSLDAQTPLFVLCNEQMSTAPAAATPAVAASGKSRLPAAVSCPFKFDAFRFDPASACAASGSSAQSSLHEWLVSVAPVGGSAQSSSNSYPAVEWSSRPVPDAGSYYPNQPALNAVLSSYVSQLNQAQFPLFESAATAPLQPICVDNLPRKDPAAAPAAADSTLAPTFQTFTLPVTACELLLSLRRFASGPLLLTLCERGFAELVTLPNQRPSVGFGRQGKFFSAGAATPASSAPLSMVPPNLLNVHALSLLAAEIGGYTLVQQHRGVSNLRVTAFGFAAARASDADEDDPATVVPLPVARTSSPVKSALKAHSSPPPVAAVTEPAVEPMTSNGAEDSNGAVSGGKKRVKFTGLTYKEQKALKRAEQARLQQLQAQAQAAAGANGATTRRRSVQPPCGVQGSFQAQFGLQSPLDVPGLVSLCLSAHPVPAAAATSAPASSSLSLAQALSVLSLSHYELDAWVRLKPLFCSAVPRVPSAPSKAKEKGSSPQLYHLESPMEHDIFLAFQRVWSSFFALPSDIYGALAHSANTDLAFELASFYCVRRRYRAAIALYTRSVEWFGPHPVTLFNRALCHVHLRSFTAARENLLAALALDSAYPSALQWLPWVESQVGGPDELPAPAIGFDKLDPFAEQPGEAADEDEQEQEEETTAAQPQANGKPAVAAAHTAVAAQSVAPVVSGSATAATPAVAAAATPAPAVAARMISPTAAAEVAAMRLADAERRKAKLAARKLLADERKAAEAAARVANGNGAAPAVPVRVVAPVVVASTAAATPAAAAATPSASRLQHSPTGSWAEVEDDGDLGPVAVAPLQQQPSARVRTKTPLHNGRVQSTAAAASNGVAATKPAQAQAAQPSASPVGNGVADRFVRPVSAPSAEAPSAAQQQSHSAPKPAYRKKGPQPNQQQQQQQPQQQQQAQSGPPRAQWQSGPAAAAAARQ